MAQVIKTTKDVQIQMHATMEFSAELTRLQIQYVFIGGFALKAYGSDRMTEDIDLLVEYPTVGLRSELRPNVSKSNRHFVESGLKYYFAPRLFEDVSGEQLLLKNSPENVRVETLATNEMGLLAQALQKKEARSGVPYSLNKSLPAALANSRKSLTARFLQLKSGHAAIASFLSRIGVLESRRC